MWLPIMFHSEDIRVKVKISCEVVEKPTNSGYFWTLFYSGRTPKFYCNLLARFTSTYWQSLFEFCSLNSVCKAWQWSRMQNLQRMGITIRRQVWTKVCEILKCRSFAVFNAIPRLSTSHFFPNIFAVKVVVRLWSRRKTSNKIASFGVGPTVFRGGDSSNFGHVF